MKKRIWLVLLIFVLAALDVIGTDQLRARACASGDAKEKVRTDNVGEQDQAEENETYRSQKNDGVPPADVAAVISGELMVFPIPDAVMHPEYQAQFEDSWMSERTFGGERGHEGTDIMLDPDIRGMFPVLSMTEGIVEKMGWLPQGGYRLGIRSTGGIYYYYAHLYDYAEDMETGQKVAAGQLLGFAGDSGYSNIEGTVGNFPVHLHVGIYYDDAQGAETAVNPYPFLMALERVSVYF